VRHPFARTFSPSRNGAGPAELLGRAARRAIRAPSIHNTQPWHFVVRGDALEIHADRTRQLNVLDPRGRQLMISCGCALYNARVAIAAAGYEPIVARFPDPDRPDIVAEVRIGAPRKWPESHSLESAIDDRRTNRRTFVGDAVPAWVVNELELAARAEDGVLFPVTNPEHRAAVARLSALADDIERADPNYVFEISAWTTDDLRRPDGVQAASVPYAGVLAGQRGRLPIRDFDVRGMGWLPASSGSGSGQTLLLFCSHDDGPQGWLHAGEALEHVWLQLTHRGYSASPLTQVIEVRETHDQLRAELGLAAQPQILLRVGQAPGTVATRRRPAAEVIVDRTGSA
jgi:nitroreductase